LSNTLGAHIPISALDDSAKSVSVFTASELVYTEIAFVADSPITLADTIPNADDECSDSVVADDNVNIFKALTHTDDASTEIVSCAERLMMLVDCR
jgi:hypothetical protein